MEESDAAFTASNGILTTAHRTDENTPPTHSLHHRLIIEALIVWFLFKKATAKAIKPFCLGNLNSDFINFDFDGIFMWN